MSFRARDKLIFPDYREINHSMDKRFTEGYIKKPAHKFKTGTLTSEEQADFDAWYQNHDDSQFLHSEARDPQGVRERLLCNIIEQTGPYPLHQDSKT